MNKGRRVIAKQSGRHGVVTKVVGKCLWVKMDDDGTEWSGGKMYWRAEPPKRNSLHPVASAALAEAEQEEGG